MNDKTTNKSNEVKSNDIDWLAFQYLTGDLPDDAVARFESSLASDQPAREALARAVELTQAVALVESTTRGSPFRRSCAGWSAKTSNYS